MRPSITLSAELLLHVVCFQTLLADRGNSIYFGGPVIERTEPVSVLKHLIFDADGYDKHTLPGQHMNVGDTTTVYVSLYIESMSSFSAVTMDFNLDLDLETIWEDKRLNHTYKYPVQVTSKDKEMSDMIWQPDVYFVNEKQMAMHTLLSPNYAIYIFPDGMVFKTERITLTLACGMDLNMFPLDDQECPLRLQSYSYMQSLVNLTWIGRGEDGNPIELVPNIRLTDMFIVDLNYTSDSYRYSLPRGEAMWSNLIAKVHTRRYITYHVLQVYLPSTLLVIISWISFWMDGGAAPARVSLTITTLLTLVSVGNGARQGLPAVSYIKAIDQWLTVCTAFIFLTLLEFTLVNYLINSTTSTCSKHKSITPGCPTCSKKWTNTARRVDITSRALFPVVFFIYAVVYWIWGIISYFT